MQIKASDIDAYVRNRKGYHPVILVYGPDQGLVGERVKTIQKQLLEGNSDPFALINLDSDEIANDPARLMDEAGTVALFGGDRVIRIKLTGAKSITKSLQATIDENLSSTTILIEAGNLKKGHAVRSLIEKTKSAAALPCYADDDRTLRRLVEDELVAANLMADEDAIRLLISLLGENRQTSRNELEKLRLYANGKDRITTEDISELIADASATLTDEIVDQVLIGNIQDGLASFQKSLALGQANFQTLFSLQRHLNMLQIMVAKRDQGKNNREIVDSARPPIHFKRKPFITQQLSLWQNNDIVKAQNHLIETIAQSRRMPNLADTLAHSVLTKIAAIIRQKSRKRF